MEERSDRVSGTVVFVTYFLPYPGGYSDSACITLWRMRDMTFGDSSVDTVTCQYGKANSGCQIGS